MAYFLQQLANAVPVAALYAVLAYGYAIAFSVTKRADLTYGALFGLAGQIVLLFSDFAYNRLWLVLPASLAVGAALAFVYTAATGLFIGRAVMRRLAATSANTVIVASLGIALVLMELSRIAADTRSLWLPPFLNAPVVLWADARFPVTLTVIQIVNAAMMLALVCAGHVYLGCSPFGRRWRAVSDDAGAAELCGVDSGRIFLGAYTLSTVFAAAAGILATSYYGTMDFGAGLVFGVKVLFIAAIGGRTSPLISAAGAAILGLGETLWSAYGPILWKDVAVIAVLVLILVLARRERFQP